MFLLTWILLLCTAVSISDAGYCKQKYKCGKKCTGWWFWKKCTDKYCYRDVCCPGFVGSKCNIDINECTTTRHGCSHTCVNTIGSYKCACPPGLKLGSNRKTCERCKFTYTCYKVCSRKTCSGWWTGKRCSTRTYSCRKLCTRFGCCNGYKKDYCDRPAG